jgi:predicted O-linked N-acetylglucosamine transferase (SPINDLY family)
VPQLSIDQSLQLAMQHHQANRLAEAEALYRQILAQQPRNADALHLLGLLAKRAGRLDAAGDLVGRAIAILPSAAAFHASLAGIHVDLGRLDLALLDYSRAIQLRPDWADAHYGQGNVLRGQGKIDAAIAAYKTAIRYNPNSAEAYNNLGDTLRVKGNLSEAIAACQRSIQLKSAFALPWNNMGIALNDQRRFEEAERAFRTAVQLEPGFATAHCNLANVLVEQKKADEAMVAYAAALRLQSDFVAAHNNLASVLRDYGMVDEALVSYEKAMALKPDDALIHGNWVCTLQYHPKFSPQAIYEAHLAWGRRHAEPLKPAVEEVVWGGAAPSLTSGPDILASSQPPSSTPEPDRRLKIGYVSPDLRMHPVGRFLLPLLQHHDRGAVEVFGYSSVRAPDLITDRLRAHADVWRDISVLTDEEVAQLVRHDRIDILVDLAGHTAQSRLLVFARKPAPVQVTWLGYPNTTGMTAMDYRITDAHADPPGMTDAFQTERLERLPETFLCYCAEDEPAASSQVPALRRGRVTFGSFNTAAKINASIVALWAQILHRVRGATLLIKCLAMGCQRSRKNLLDLFAAHGISADRLELQGHVASHGEHLRVYDQVDVALDTFPYHGTTTTCEALWMGVPVVTLAGSTHVSRVGASILANAGMEKWVAHSGEEYVEMAVRLAGDLAGLADTRTQLRQRMRQSPLMDAARFARNVEAAFRKMRVDAGRPDRHSG